jgi:hypothetical protein
MASVGRISGPLLKSNLLRNGIDLAFETDLLYLDVNNQRIGIKTTTPQHDLDINGTTKTTNLQVTNKADIANITIDGDTISSSSEYLNLATLDSVVSLNRLEIDSFKIEGNLIQTVDSNADIDFDPNGTGSVNVKSDLNIDGNLFVSGDIRADGNITVGDANTDNIVFNAEINSDIIPDQDNTYTLGSDPTLGGNEFADVFTNKLTASSVDASELEVEGIDLTLRQGNVYYVASNGDDAHTGDHILDPFASIGKAISESTAGDTIYVYPGEYQESFPIIVPQGVTLRGHGLRTVTVVPTSTTQSNDAFLLNGESTVENLTVKDFFYNSSIDTGYGFKFNPGISITTRSPYVRNVSVITKGSVTSQSDPRGYDAGDAGRGILLDGSIVAASSVSVSCLFNQVTLITPGVDAMTLKNGVRVEWLNCFTYFARTSINALDESFGARSSGETELRVSGLEGSYSQGELIQYYDNNGSLLESSVISRVDPDGKIFVSGKQDGFELPDRRTGKTITANGDAQLDTSVKKFGSASLRLDGTSDYASVTAQDDFGFGTDDFTVEGWFYPTSSIGVERLLDFRAGQINDNAVAINTDGLTPRVFVQGAYQITGSTDLSVDVWNHVAYTRSGAIGTLYLNGTDVGSWTDNTDYGTTKPLTIGALFDGSTSFFQGNIDDVRVIKGTAVAPESGGPSFRVSVTEDTVFMARFDGEDASTEFEDDAIISQDIRFSNGATATKFTLVDFTDFGAEVRIISSASVYGEFGIVGNGRGVLIYAIGHNFAYIGNEKYVTNDPTTVIQANEVIETNGANVRFSSVDHLGDFRVGDLFFVNQDTGEVNFSTNNLTVETTDGITFTDGSNTTIIDATKAQTGNIRIGGNTIESLTGDINLFAYSDKINLENDVDITGNLDVTGNIAIGGNITLGDSSQDSIEFVAGINSDIVPSEDKTYNLGSSSAQWKNLYIKEIITENIVITENYIETTLSNSDLEIRANSAGSVVAEDIAFTDNVISTQGDLIFEPSSEITVFDSTGTVNLPVGTTAERPYNNYVQLRYVESGYVGDIDNIEGYSENQISQAGQIRFNSDLNRFEGYDGSFWIKLNGVQDIDGDTNVTAEQTPGANDNIIRFTVEDNTVVFIDEEKLNAPKLIVDDFVIDNNLISTKTSNTDLIINSNGTGSIVFDNLAINTNVIQNIESNAVTVFDNTDNGYVKFDGTSGLVIPIGQSDERPPVAFSEPGLMRLNTDDNRVEIWDGLNWISVAGQEAGLSRTDAETIAFENIIAIG